MSFEYMIRIFRQVVSIVDDLHSRGVFFLDLSPERFLVTDEDVVMFRTPLASREEFIGEGLLGPMEKSLIHNILSPELIGLHPFDVRSNVYALGVIAYQMITGKPPFPFPIAEFQAPEAIDDEFCRKLGKDLASMVDDSPLRERLTKDPIPPREERTDCPRGLNALVMKALSRHLEVRHQSVKDMLEELGQIDRSHEVQ